MAAGSNWKRPWQEEDEQIAYSRYHLPSQALLANSSERHTLDPADYGAQHNSGELISSPGHDRDMVHGASNILSPSPHRPVAFLVKTEDQRSLSNCSQHDNKRRRVTHTQPQGAFSRRFSALQEEGYSRGSGFEGMV